MTSVLEMLSDAVAIFDRNWHFLFVNPQEADLIGRKPEELLGQSLWDIYPEAKNSPFSRELERVLTEQVAVRFQPFYAALNRHVEVRAYPIPQGVLILHQDITPWKRAEQELQQTCDALSCHIAEQLTQLQQIKTALAQQTQERQQAEAALQATNAAFARLLESIADGFCAIDTQWQFTYVNRRAEQLLQKCASELLGKSIWGVYPSWVGSEFYQCCLEAIDAGRSVQLEMHLASLDRWFEVTLYPSRSGLSLFFQDTTERKQIEQERDRLLQQEQEAHARVELAHQRCLFLSHASDIFASSLNYEMTLANVAQLAVPLLADFCLIHKLEADQTLRPVSTWHRDERQQPLVDEFGILVQASSGNCNSPIAQVLRTGEPLLVTDFSAIEPLMPSRTLDIHRQLAPRALLIVPLTARGQKFGTLTLAMAASNREYGELDRAVASDLGRRAAIAIDNANLYKQAQEASRLKDEFLMVLSHELRTPLNAIVGWAQILQRRQLSHKTKEQALAVIGQKAEKLTQLVYDLLSLSQTVTGQLRLRPGLVKLNALVQEVIQSLQLTAAAKEIRLVTSLSGFSGSIEGDERYLRQVIWNLVSNAIKFTPSGGCVEIHLHQAEQTIQLMVRDTGKGIASDLLPYIFDSFRQADGSRTRFYEGMGVGLPLARHLAELHGGRIEAFSEGEGKGATFTVHLPVARSLTLPESQQQSIGSSTNHSLLAEDALILKNLRVLLVDHQLDSHDALVAQLEQDGAEVLGVASAEDAMELLQHLTPHVVLVHLRQRSIGNGEMQLLAKTKAYAVERGSRIPTVVLAPGSRQERSQALSLGFQVCLSQQSPPEDIAMVVGAIAKPNHDQAVEL